MIGQGSGLTLNCRHGIAASLELILRETLPLQHGRFLDRVQHDVVVGAVVADQSNRQHKSTLIALISTARVITTHREK